jgi:hypothetical protein
MKIYEVIGSKEQDHLLFLYNWYKTTSDTHVKIELLEELRELIDKLQQTEDDQLLIDIKTQLHRDLINLLKS